MQRPSHEDKVRSVFGRRAAIYTTSAAHTDREVLDWLVRRACPRPEWRALDVATGAGHTAFALAPHLASVIGVDITPQMLEEAGTLGGQKGLGNVSFHLADVHRLPFADASFDLVTCRRAPHHFSDIGQALTEMKRVLKPGGRLVIDDRAAPEDDEADEIMNRLDTLHDETHVREYRPAEWRAMVEQAGFWVESIEPWSSLRPLSSLTKAVEPGRAEEIRRIVSSLDKRLKALLQVERRGGEVHHLHFYIMIAAVKP